MQREEIVLTLDGRIKSVTKAVIDEYHCNPLKAWKDMGKPEYLKKEHLKVLEDALKLIYEEIPVEDADSQRICFTAEPESVTIFKVALK